MAGPWAEVYDREMMAHGIYHRQSMVSRGSRGALRICLGTPHSPAGGWLVADPDELRFWGQSAVPGGVPKHIRSEHRDPQAHKSCCAAIPVHPRRQPTHCSCCFEARHIPERISGCLLSLPDRWASSISIIYLIKGLSEKVHARANGRILEPHALLATPGHKRAKTQHYTTGTTAVLSLLQNLPKPSG